MEMMLHTNGNKKKAGITMLISDKIDFKTKMIIRDKEALHNEKGINPAREYNICINKYLCTQHRNT